MPRRGEHIYKRKDGRWEGRYIKCYDDSKKAVYASVYAHTYGEVKTKLNDAKNTISNQINFSKESKTTLEVYSSKWLNHIQAQIKHSTFVKYSNIIKNHILPILGSHTIKELTTEAVKNFADNKLVSGNVQNGAGLSVKTVRDILSILHLIVRYAEELGAECVCNFDILAIHSLQQSTEPINDSEHMILVKYLLKETDNVKLGILLCLYTGIRIGEICALRFDDISLQERSIRVNKTMQRLQTLNEKSKSKTTIVISSPKSAASCREIPLPDFIIDVIRQKPYIPRAYILTGDEDNYMEPRTLENKFKKCLKMCGLKEHNFHQLRHRFATYCIELGFEIKTLSEILGHSSVNITLNRYMHSSLELKRTNMNKLQAGLIY